MRVNTPLSNIPFYAQKHPVHQHSFNLKEQKRYYSSIDVEIYFGDIYIDEVVHLEYVVQQNAMPLFGYNSYIYDQVALGSRLITGSFAINFTMPGYLFMVLEELSKRGIRSATMTVGKANEGTIFDNTYTGSQILDSERMPLWPQSFDIDIVFGKKEKGMQSYRSQKDIILEGVHIVNCTQQLDTTGEPVFDSYSFLARDIKTLSGR